MNNRSSLLRQALGRFPPESRRQGELFFRTSKVLSVGPAPAGPYVASVEDKDAIQEVSVSVEPNRVVIQCQCGQDTCGHGYAAALSLLADSSLNQARALSEGAVLPKPEPDDLKRWAETQLKRALTPNEARQVQNVQQGFEVYKTYGFIPLHLADRLGLGLGVDQENLRAVAPENVVAFWKLLCHTAKQQGSSVAAFLSKVTDTSDVEKMMQAAARTAEIHRWRLLLKDADYEFRRPPKQRETLGIDLRLVISREKAFLMWKTDEGKEYHRLHRRDVDKLGWSGGSPDPRLTPEGQILRAALVPVGRYFTDCSLDLRASEDIAKLEAILRTPILESRVFLGTELLIRHREPLKWILVEPVSADGDYEIRLVKADGGPMKEVWCATPGGMFITAEGLFMGSPPPPLLNEYPESIRIPAQALETQQGAEYLTNAGMELPEPLRRKTRPITYEVSIECSLTNAQKGEICQLVATAEAKRAPTLIWESVWLEQHDPSYTAHDEADDDVIYVPDRTRLNEISCLLEELPLRNTSGRLGRLSMRAGKNFGAIFGDWIRKVPPWVKLKLQGELASFTESDIAGTVSLEVAEKEIDWFDLSVVLNVSDTTLTPSEIKLLLAAKGQFVRLQGKGWRRLRYELSEEDNLNLAKLGLSTTDFNAEPQRLHALQLGNDAARNFIPPAQVKRLERRVAELQTRITPPVPSSIRAELRPYQVAGFHFLAFLTANRFGGILADDMGLGKTLETLTWLAWLREDGKQTRSAAPSPSLVVCPKSVMDNWRSEATRFAPELRVRVWSSGDVHRLPNAVSEVDLHIINYAQLRSMGEQLQDIHWLALILDEGQYIKNPTSQTAVVARSLSAGNRVVLTGTPIENRLLDLWSLMAFAMPGVLGNRAHFTRVFDSKNDPLARERLAARVRPFLLRRTKAQVAKDLPDKIEEDLFCEMEGDQLALYKAELKRAQQMLLSIQTQKELAGQQIHFLTSLLRLRQICCDPRLLDDKLSGQSAKVEALLDVLEPLMEEGEKVLVFSQFVGMLDLMKAAIAERGWPFFYLVGSTEDRGELVKGFNESTGASVFLISLKAGGFGLNLASASYVVLFDPWWNPAVENQAIDRTHRIGQVNKVIAYRLLIKNSVEEKIRALQKAKSALAEDVLGEERFAQSLSLDDLRFLLSD